MAEHTEVDWVDHFADEVIAAAGRRGLARIVCASGLSPSGPIHLGNLREVMTPHLVADEIKRRGYDCVHLLSWDDYDRFRRVPAGIDPSWAEHIGKPLTSVPAPPGSDYPNWAEHFKAPMIAALAELGIDYDGISQTERYTSGAYRDQILLAMRERKRIGAILARYQTKGKPAPEHTPAADLADGTSDDVAAAMAAEGSGAAYEDDGTTAGDYYPYKPYCSSCNKDLTTVTSYDDETTALSYVCACGHRETMLLSEDNHGKLVWKVDWPMRWAYERVVFEPSGVDHSSPGSSFVVGSQLVREIFSQEPPIGPMYAFVGITGMAKMSSSRGLVPTPADALEIMEGPVRRIADGPATPREAAVYSRSIRTSVAELPRTPRPVAYRTLSSIVDITTNHEEQILRILRYLEPDAADASLAEFQPRLACAQAWVATQMAADQRTQVRSEPDAAMLATLSEDERTMLRLFLDGLDSHWSLEGLTTWVYGVPKLQLGLSLEVQPTPELKAAQRTFFALLYRLLVGRETGPRLPTLLLAIGADRVRDLVSVPASDSPAAQSR